MSDKKACGSQQRWWWMPVMAVSVLVCCEGCLPVAAGLAAAAATRSREPAAARALSNKPRRRRGPSTAGQAARRHRSGGSRLCSSSPSFDTRRLTAGYRWRSYRNAWYRRARPSIYSGRARREPVQRRAQSSNWTARSLGPRMGLIYVTGDAAEYLKAQYDTGPVITTWGWQFEWQYETSSDSPVGLVEFVPLVAGLDIGLPIATANLLLGLRTSGGLEFVAGPNASLTEDQGGVGMTVAVGKTFQAGELKLPVNLAVVSNRSGQRYSITFGWNLRQ